MSTLSDLLYQQPQQQEDSPFSDIRRRIVQEMMLAQNKVPAGMQKQIIESDPELFGPRPVAPTVPQGGGYKTGSDFVQKPLTQQQIDEFRRRALQDARKIPIR